MNGETPHPPLYVGLLSENFVDEPKGFKLSQFCVSVSGFKVVDPLATEIFGLSYSTPTLHVIGKTDVIVVEERSKVLLDVSTNARVEEHAGGWHHHLSLRYTSRARRSFCSIESQLEEIL